MTTRPGTMGAPGGQSRFEGLDLVRAPRPEGGAKGSRWCVGRPPEAHRLGDLARESLTRTPLRGPHAAVWDVTERSRS